mgnify:CR=1 FL=1
MMKRILRCGLFLLLLLLPAVSVSAGEAGQIQVEVGAKGLMKFYDSFPVKVTLSQWPEGEYEICLETVTGWPVSLDFGNSFEKVFLLNGGSGSRRENFIRRSKVETDAEGNAEAVLLMGMASFGGNIRYTIYNEEKEACSQEIFYVAAPKENEISTMVISEQGDLEQTVRETHLIRETDQMAMNFITRTWNAEQVPRDGEILRQIQVVTAEAGELEKLDEAQRETLSRWEENGGILVETTGETAAEDLKNRMTEETLNHIFQNNINGYNNWDRSGILEEAPIRDNPSARLYMGILLLYIALSGPGLYFFLKRKRKRYFLFPGILGLSLLVTVMIGILGSRDKIKAPFLVYEARYLQGESGTVSLDAVCGIRAPYNKDYTLYTDPSCTILPYQESVDSAYWDGESETKEMIQMEMSEGEEKDKITFRNLPTFQPIYFSVQKPDFQDTFAEAEISFYEEELSGTVTNCSPYQISHVQLLLKDQGLISLGDLQPGETVSLEGKTFLLGDQEVWQREMEASLSEGEENWKQYLGQLYQQCYYMMGNDSGKLIGVVENADPDFQMDSGYEIYGRSMLVASVSVDYESGGEVYDPWFADRGMDGSQDYTVPQGIYIEQGEKEVRYQVKGELLRFRFLPREYVEARYLVPFEREISFYNWKTGQYDRIEDWEERIFTEEEMKPYLNEEKILQIRYGAGKQQEQDPDGVEYSSFLPAIAVTETGGLYAEG